VTAESRQPATRRILGAARSLVGHGGAAAVSMGDVAAHAGVSKALVHYHFRDKDTLLRALVEDVGSDVLERQREAMARTTDAHALDAYWTWLSAELTSGDVRILVSLTEYGSDPVRTASREVAAQRRALIAEHAASVFTQLGLTPRIPAALIGDTLLAFLDGLAVAHTLEPERDPRPAFDVLWLALLTLVD
jgi:AcrR family transcriptional regulator